MAYYSDKLQALKELFGADDVALEAAGIVVGGAKYPIIDDVIVIAPQNEYTAFVKSRLESVNVVGRTDIARDIQKTFGAEWQEYSQVLPEHKKEFLQYFDIVDLPKLKDARVLDVGCGNGRWSHFLKDKCRQLALVDFSDAIFMARNNLRDNGNALFFMCDLRKIPFAENCADFLMCLGVLHHLPVPCLDEVRRFKRYAPQNLIFLYYALDNRPFYFGWMLTVVTFVRMRLSGVNAPWLRKTISVIGVVTVYAPLIFAGKFAAFFGLGKFVPLFEFYSGKSFKRIEQDVYDRFFTRIEQRVSKQEIMALRDTYSSVRISENLPYYHFVCER